MKTKFFQRTAAMLLCIFMCAGTALPLMGAAFAAEEETAAVCVCDTRCVEGAPNADCPVCAHDATACTGAEAETSAEPEAPTEPEAPAESEIPAESEASTEPKTPTEPETPVESETPAEPEPSCTCEMRCAEGAPNKDCAVCAQDISGCTGAEPEPACICTAHCEPGAVNADCPVCLLDLAACTIEAPAPVPACICESRCELGAVNPDCPICKMDLTGCTGKAPEPLPAFNLSIQITPPSGWATNRAEAEFRITDESGGGLALVQVKIEKNGQWRDVTDNLKQRNSRWYGEIELSENCTVYVCATGHDGKVYEKSRYIECFDRTAPTLRASIDGKLLRAEAKDDLSGVSAIYIDGEKYTDLTNGTLDVALKDLPDDYEQLSVQAVDEAGNKSKIVQVKNPNYQTEDRTNRLRLFNSPAPHS